MNQRPDDSALAAEYVLGLLAEDVRADVDRRIAFDESFAHMVDLWRGRFAEFDETAEEHPPSDDLWSLIERDVANPPVVQPRARDTLQRFWGSLHALRLATMCSAAAAIGFAVLAIGSLYYARDVASRTPVYVAVLVNEATGQTGAVVNVFAGGRVEMIPLTDIDVPEGRALQIWTLWDRAVGPRPVGLITRAHAIRLDLENLPATSADQLFEITLEPAGGSPVGRPTGPILFKGTTARAL